MAYRSAVESDSVVVADRAFDLLSNLPCATKSDDGNWKVEFIGLFNDRKGSRGRYSAHVIEVITTDGEIESTDVRDLPDATSSTLYGVLAPWVMRR